MNSCGPLSKIDLVGLTQKLSVDGVVDPEDWFGKPCQYYGADEGTGNSPMKGRVVKMSLEFFRGVVPWYAVSQDVMSSLYVERLLDFCVRSHVEMDKY